MNFQMFKLVLEKAEEPDIKLSTSTGSWKKQESSRKKVCFTADAFSVFTAKTVDCGSQQSGSQQTGKFFKRWEYQTTWPASWETYMQVRQQQLELDMEQQIGSK